MESDSNARAETRKIMDINHIRTRWAAVGAAVAITLGAGGIGLVSATSPSDAVTYVPITPCRLADTRAGDDNVGPRKAPIGPTETLVIMAEGNNGNCVGIPASATGLGLNVTALGATERSFLTIWGAGDRPTVSNLNPIPGAPPIPNAVTTGLTADGKINIYNNAGTVNVIVDIAGYYTDHNHDDHYYTKTEVDALIAPLTNGVAAYAGGQQMTNLTTTDTTYRTVSLMPPADGTVIVTSSAYFYNTSGIPVIARCVITKGATVLDEPGYFQYANMPSSNGSEVISGTRGFTVTEGALFTVNLVCDTFSGTASINDSSLTAIFAPT
jgi:hypothetical protein